MTHPLSPSWKMTPFLKHLKPAFVLIQAKGQGYGWLLNHLSIHFTLHIYFHLSVTFSSQFDLALDI
jgi:hypothetical protein